MSKTFDELSKGINEVKESFNNTNSNEVKNYGIMLVRPKGISAEFDTNDSTIYYKYYLTKDKKSYMQVNYDMASMTYMLRLCISYRDGSQLENIAKNINNYNIKLVFNDAIRLDMDLDNKEIQYYTNIILADKAVTITYFTNYDDFNSFESLFVKKVFKDLSVDAKYWLDNIPLIIKFERKEDK